MFVISLHCTLSRRHPSQAMSPSAPTCCRAMQSNFMFGGDVKSTHRKVCSAGFDFALCGKLAFMFPHDCQCVSSVKRSPTWDGEYRVVGIFVETKEKTILPCCNAPLPCICQSAHGRKSFRPKVATSQMQRAKDVESTHRTQLFTSANVLKVGEKLSQILVRTAN